MKEWFTPLELATLSLPGLPNTKRGVNDLARREGWTSQPRQGRGGGKEYHLSVLPPEARQELEARAHREAAKQALAVAAAKQQRQIATLAPSSLTARQRNVMEARAAILLELDRRITVEGISVTAAIRTMVADSIAGILPVELQALVAIANDRNSGDATLSERSLFRWRTAREDRSVTGLAPELSKASPGLPQWFGTFFSYYAKPQKPTITIALTNWQQDFPAETLPTYRQVRIALDKLGAVERLRGRMGAQELKTVQAYKVRDTADLLPSSVYVADGKTYDAEIAHPIHGQPFRPELTTIIDAHTRKIVGFSVSLDENRFGVADALRVACCYAGIPALFYTDNGPGYINETMTDTLTGFLARLGITPMKALPYNSQAKGIVERLNRMWSDDARQYDTYIGRDMDKEAKRGAFKKTRKELAMFGESKTLPGWNTFQENCFTAIDLYNNSPHSGLPRMADPETGRQRHMTPNEMWQRAEEHGFEAIKVSAVEADDLFRPWVIRKVSRCMVSWMGNSYFALDLEQYHGREVILAYDLQNAQKVWLREIDQVNGERAPGRLITVAAFEGNKTRYVPVSYEQAAIEKRAKGRERRLEKKLDVVRQEIRPTALLEAQPVTPIIDAMPKAEPHLAVVETAPQKPSSQSQQRTMANGRPRFSTDVDLVRWLLANPGTITPSDRDYIASEIFNSHTAKELLRMSGVDLNAVRSLLRSAA